MQHLQASASRASGRGLAQERVMAAVQLQQCFLLHVPHVSNVVWAVMMRRQLATSGAALMTAIQGILPLVLDKCLPDMARVPADTAQAQRSRSRADAGQHPDLVHAAAQVQCGSCCGARRGGRTGRARR